jgi:hypothetical protein
VHTCTTFRDRAANAKREWEEPKLAHQQEKRQARVETDVEARLQFLQPQYDRRDEPERRVDKDGFSTNRVNSSPLSDSFIGLDGLPYPRYATRCERRFVTGRF